MNKFFGFILKLFFVIVGILFVTYLILPAPSFPEPPSDSIQSIEGGDIETPLRRAYFTDFTREEILEHYQNQFSKSSFFGIPLLTYRLNYPPEEAQMLIRDQTRSTFLEEIVHPLRESFYVNGFKAEMAKDDIWYRGQHFSQKITVKYITGNRFISVTVAIFIILSICLLVKDWKDVIINLIKYVRKN